MNSDCHHATGTHVIASDQAASTEETTKKTLAFLDYVCMYPEAILHSNALYLCKLKAKSRTGGHSFLSDNARDPSDNGAVLNIAKQKEDCDVIGHQSRNRATAF